MSLSIDPDAIVLIAIITRPLDLPLPRDAHWYRLPLAHARRILIPAVLALYQTAAFGAERWSVRFFAPVRGHELTTRRDLLPAEPNHPRADQPYLEFQLGPL